MQYHHFRIFNPYLQSKKFDKEALYIKKWLPELVDLDPKRIHDEGYLMTHTLSNYLRPMLEHKTASKHALEYFKNRL